MRNIYITLISLAVVALFLLNLFFGAVEIPGSEVTGILLGESGIKESWRYIVLENRLPQALTAMLGGGGLAVTGLMLQTAFRNSLAGPDIFGVNSGASLGVGLVILLFGGVLTAGTVSFTGFLAVVAGAFAGAMAVIGIIMLISTVIRSNMMLLIAGIMIGYLASSAITLLNFLSDEQGVQSYVVWGMGTFSGVTMEQMPLFAGATLPGMAAALLLVKPLNALLLGDAYARNLGVNPLRVRNCLLLTTGWLTAVVTAYCGPISFIGLAVPHIVRLLLRTDNHALLMPWTIATGAAVGMLCALLCSLPGDAGLLPLNAVTPLIGAPVIIYVIARNAKR